MTEIKHISALEDESFGKTQIITSRERYDGPIDGFCLWEGVRRYFIYLDDDGDSRIYGVYEITEDLQKALDDNDYPTTFGSVIGKFKW